MLARTPAPERDLLTLPKQSLENDGVLVLLYSK